MEHRFAKKIVGAIERQLSKPAYFNKDVSEETKELISETQMVTSGCEGHFVVLDWHSAKHVGSMSISTVSELQVVSRSRYLESKEMNNDSYLGGEYKWARSSEEANKINSLEHAFFEKVSVYREQALYGKEQAKRRKEVRVLKLFDRCKIHEGPVTKASIHISRDFTIEDMQIDTSYLKNIIAPTLKI